MAQLLLEARHGELHGDPGAARGGGGGGPAPPAPPPLPRARCSMATSTAERYSATSSSVASKTSASGVPSQTWMSCSAASKAAAEICPHRGFPRSSESAARSGEGKRSEVIWERRLSKPERMRIMSSAAFLDVASDLTMCCAAASTLSPPPAAAATGDSGGGGGGAADIADQSGGFGGEESGGNLGVTLLCLVAFSALTASVLVLGVGWLGSPNRRVGSGRVSDRSHWWWTEKASSTLNSGDDFLSFGVGVGVGRPGEPCPKVVVQWTDDHCSTTTSSGRPACCPLPMLRLLLFFLGLSLKYISQLI